MWNLLEDVSLFDRPAGRNSEYDAHVHLAQIVSLLGDPPEEIIKMERLYRKVSYPIIDPHGKQCKNMNEYWGGPFFDDDSELYYQS